MIGVPKHVLRKGIPYNVYTVFMFLSTASYVTSYQHVTPVSTQVTPTPPSWQHTQSPSVAGVDISTQSPLSTAWQQQTTPTMSTPQRADASAKSTPSSHHRHERHTTLDHAKQLLHLEDGEFMVRALYDFTASTRDEIPLKRGILIS